MTNARISWQSIALIVLAIAISLWFGLGYNSGNQNTYSIGGLVDIDPNFLKGDWFAHDTYHYHANFSWVLQTLDALGIPLGWGTVSIEMLLRLLGMGFIYQLISSLCKPSSRLLAFSMVAVVILLERTISLMGSYLIAEALQPSSFGSILTLGALACFVKGRFGWSGLLVTAGGFMHTNFLLLGFVFFGTAHLLLGRERFISRCVWQFSAMSALLLWNLPFLLSMAGAKGAEQADYIFQFVRSPYHYVPMRYLHDFLPFIAWCLLGGLGLYYWQGDRQLKHRVTAIYASLVLVLSIASLLTTVVFIPVISKLFFWRFAPYAVLFGQCLIAVAAVQVLTSNQSIKRQTIFSAICQLFVLLIAAGCLFKSYWYRYGLISYQMVVVGLLCCLWLMCFVRGFFAVRVERSKLVAGLFGAVCALLLIPSFALSVDTVIEKSTWVNGYPVEEDERTLYAWVRDNTPDPSLFLAPLDMQDFRLHARRAVVVDWKSTPVDAPGLLEWYARVEEISGVQNFASKAEAENGYANMDSVNLAALREKFQIDYVVLQKEHPLAKLGAPIVFQNAKYLVLDLQQ